VQHGITLSAAKGLGLWLRRIAPRAAHGAVTVAILPDSQVKRLNRTFRQVDKPTDVLSFPSEPAEQRSRGRVKTNGQKREKYLGDIVIARGVAQKQAKKLGHPTAVEFRVLALHGLLHLLGYDHEVDKGKMARAEARLRRKSGLPLGLIARVS
jgi:probable rRNA maturation factor